MPPPIHMQSLLALEASSREATAYAAAGQC